MRRIPASVLKRLERIEQTRSAKRPRALFPPILPHDEWEALAVVSQAELVFLTREHLDTPGEVVTTPDPADVTHRYKPNASNFGTVVKSIP